MSFDLITTGPVSPTGAAPQAAPNGLILDQQNNVVSSVGKSGVGQALQNALTVLQAQTALATITTAQVLLTKALNAYFLNQAGRTLLVTGYGVFTTPAGTPTMTFAITLGGVTLCSITTAATAGSGTNIPFQFQFTLSTATTGAAGTIESHGSLTVGITAVAAAAMANYTDTNTAVSAAINLTTALSLALTIAGSTTITSAQLRLATIEVVA
jgi:hypothetical protein